MLVFKQNLKGFYFFHTCFWPYSLLFSEFSIFQKKVLNILFYKIHPNRKVKESVKSASRCL